MIKLKKIIKIDEEIPKWYGAAYRVPGYYQIACYLIPINLLVFWYIKIKDYIKVPIIKR